ncbi:hypothetical protein MAPG_07387 [Magnaporthiopsis poae ATCC 64411]|uniref:Uncharacterized protein n=1 Tax=Magnaporthiopsis poae (strain ATCC 64411 / 73-15) TaxID=644358 RepID=A0A0C4E4J3_MAGP6|nr:hypothetical protein MAPG_07387 [Magnaporthiopsis poae ATCC 64411]
MAVGVRTVADLIAAPCLGISTKIITEDGIQRICLTVLLTWKVLVGGSHESHKDEITTHGLPTLGTNRPGLPPSAAFAVPSGCFLSSQPAFFRRPGRPPGGLKSGQGNRLMLL